MKADAILLNWVFSFMGLCIDTETAPMWAIFLVLGWFMLSTILLRRGIKKGMFKIFDDEH